MHLFIQKTLSELKKKKKQSGLLFTATLRTRRVATEFCAPEEIEAAIKKNMCVEDYLGSAQTAVIGLG